jgi:hypothetical protein
MVRDLDKSGCLLAPRRNAQTAKWPRLVGIAAEIVTTFPNGIISAIAMFAISQNATNAWILCIVTSATKNSATTAKIASTVGSAA